jgi:TonB family protein
MIEQANAGPPQMMIDGAQQALSAPIQNPSYSIAGPSRIYQVGGGVSAPRLIFAPDPEFTDEARRAHYQGVCVVAVIVDPQGNTQRPQVVRRLGKGQDQKAIEAVREYKFKPAMLYGKPVAVQVNLDVNFRLW